MPNNAKFELGTSINFLNPINFYPIGLEVEIFYNSDTNYINLSYKN